MNDRIQTLRNKMAGQNLQGIIIEDPVNVKYLTGIKSKFPIIIEESRNIIFFPTSSTREKQSTWLALSKIKKYQRNYRKNCDVVFNNDSRISLDISYYSLDNQFVRAIMLKNALYERKIDKQND